jgi:SHS2 domain-containing protein
LAQGVPQAGFDWIDHTADLGVRVWAPTLERLLETAGRALAEALYEGAGGGRPACGVCVEAADRPALLVEWLSELLFLMTTGGWVLGHFEVTLQGESRLRAEVGGERFDPARHRLRTEVKAPTFHGLRLDRHPAGWQAQVIFDL